MNTVMTPSAVWEGFDPNKGDFNTRLLEESEGLKRYLYSAINTSDGDVRIQVDFYTPSFDSKNTVLVVGPLEKKPQEDLIVKLVNKGYNVILPDYSGVFKGTKTRYPLSYEYGSFPSSGEHLKKVCPTAKETCFYLYTVVLRRLISFAESVLNVKDIVVMGITGGVEVALQLVGTDKRPIGLICIAGAGYREYVNYPKYASSTELAIDKELMYWLTGVSGTAYAKHIKVPVMIAIGSNGSISDIDRLSNLLTIMNEAEVRITVSSGYMDNINKSALKTVFQWLDGTFLGSTPPELPTIKVGINSEGALYGKVATDGCIKIKTVRIYYSFNDNNHTTRFWQNVDADYIGDNEFLGKIKVVEGQEKLFVYGEVEYVNGLILDGVVNYTDLKDAKVNVQTVMPNPIIFQYPDENGFIELNDHAVIMSGNLCEGVLPIGLKGLYCATGGMVTYSIGRKSGYDSSRLLQIDSYSATGKYKLTVRAACAVGDKVTQYTVSRDIEARDTFFSLRLSPSDFKDNLFQPMESWQGIKSLTIVERNVIIGKIMFI